MNFHTFEVVPKILQTLMLFPIELYLWVGVPACCGWLFSVLFTHCVCCRDGSVGNAYFWFWFLANAKHVDTGILKE